jgi:hypothetical protein
MAAHAQVPKGAAQMMPNISPKDGFDTIAGVALIGEEP